MSVWPSVWMAAIVSLMMRSGSSCSARVICASVILKMSDGESNLSSSSALIADMPQGDVWMCNWGFSNSVTKQVYRICVHALRTGRFAENAPFSVCAWNRISKRALFQRFGATWWWQHNARLTRQMLNVTGYYNVRPIKKKNSTMEAKPSDNSGGELYAWSRFWFNCEVCRFSNSCCIKSRSRLQRSPPSSLECLKVVLKAHSSLHSIRIKIDSYL